jgi:hypothetical protein
MSSGHPSLAHFASSVGSSARRPSWVLIPLGPPSSTPQVWKRVDFNVAYSLDLANLGRAIWGVTNLSIGTHGEDRNDFPFAANPTQANTLEFN